MSKINKVKCQMLKINKVKFQMSKINKVKCQMSKINKVNFDGAYLRSSSGHFFFLTQEVFAETITFRFLSLSVLPPKLLHWLMLNNLPSCNHKRAFLTTQNNISVHSAISNYFSTVQCTAVCSRAFYYSYALCIIYQCIVLKRIAMHWCIIVVQCSAISNPPHSWLIFSSWIGHLLLSWEILPIFLFAKFPWYQIWQKSCLFGKNYVCLVNM